jgi:hypothetical protein
MRLHDGVNVLVASTVDAFAVASRRLKGDETLWTSLSEKSIENIQAHFSLDAARQVLCRAVT